MSPIVHDAEAERLAQEIASATGDTPENVAVDALRRRHAALSPAGWAGMAEVMAFLQTDV